MSKFLILSFLLHYSLHAFADGNTGGMDGGGGGTLPVHPATIQQIEVAARNARPQILALLNGYEIIEKPRDQIPLYRKLFGGRKKVQEVLNDLRLEVRVDRPCFTANNVEVDGSIYAQKSNTVCLSAFRIAGKLDFAAAEREVTALLIHELSHFMGADESEAVHLQQQMAQAYLDYPDRRINVDQLQNGLAYFSGDLYIAINLLKTGKLVETDKILAEAFTWLKRYEPSRGFLPFDFFATRESDYQDLLKIKLQWAKAFLLTQIPGPDQANAQSAYNNAFKRLDYFMAGTQLPQNSLYAGEKIFKLHTLLDLTNLIEEIYNQYSIRGLYIGEVVRGGRWLALDGHFTVPPKNPWEKFLGEYEIQSVQCTGQYKPPSEVKFKLTKDQDGLYLRIDLRDGHYGLMIEFGSSNWAGTLINYGETPDGGVFMVHQSGGGWTRDGQIDDFKLKRLPGGKFEISKTVNKTSLRMDVPDEVGTCVYTGLIK